ncbi:hypothetical protein [Legionella nautarum]|nr:hypothetical protein [Legionella nautarum]
MSRSKLEPRENSEIEPMSFELTETELLLARQQALEMQEPVSFQFNPPPEDVLTIALFKKVPFLSGFLRSVDGTGVAISKLAYIEGRELAGSINSGFRVAGVIIAFIDFIRIPLMFYAAWLLGCPLPITLSHAGRWLYSAVVLGLALAGVLAPVPVAPIIALCAGSLALAVSVFILVKHFYDRSQTKQALIQGTIDIERAESQLQNLVEKAQRLSVLLNDPGEVANYPDYVKQIKKMQTKLQRRKEKLQKLYDKQFENMQLMKDLSGSAVRDKKVGMALAIVAVIGLALAIFFPHIGLVLFAISAATSGLYLIGLLTYLLVPIVIEKFRAKSAMEITQIGQLEDNGLEYDKSLASTSIAMLTLSGMKEEKKSSEQEQHLRRLKQIDNNLSDYLERSDVPKIIYFFSEMASYTQAHQASEEDIKIFLDYFTHTNRALQILNDALCNGEVAKEEEDKLLSYRPLTWVLIARGVTGLDSQPAHFVQPLHALNYCVPPLPDMDFKSNLEAKTV